MPVNPWEGFTAADFPALLDYLGDVGQHELEGYLGGPMGGFADWVQRWKADRDAAATAAAKPDLDKPCEHRATAASVSVAIRTDGDDGPVVGYDANVRVWCAIEGCGEGFEFVGAPIGYSPRQLMTSFNGKELRAPIVPESASERFGQDGPAVGMRIIG